MAVTVVFLGKLRDLAGTDSMRCDAPLDWAGLEAAVPHAVRAAIQGDRINIACEGRVLADRTALHARDGEEVALLPPVSGG